MRTKMLIAIGCSLWLLVPGCSDDDDGAGEAGAGGSGGADAPGGSAGTAGAAGSAGSGGAAGAAGAGGAEPLAVALEPTASGLTSPVVLKPAPDDSGRLFVVDQTGVIRILSPDGELLATPFLDLSESIVDLNAGFDERGLLGLAFHPEYDVNQRFFVYYSAPLRAEAPQDYDHTSHISEFQASSADPNVADPASERVLLAVDQPQFNHDAGQIAFGPDGYLYIPLGDGGGANDDQSGHVEDWYEVNGGGNGQDVQQNLLGSILRIDVDGGDPYGIPADNPFAGDPEVLDEIWAYGFRNPFRIAFDVGGTNQLFVGDAGQNLWEEVSIVEAGQNYGWNVMEGTHCFSTETPSESLADCPTTGAMGEPLVDPILEYANANQQGGIGFVVIGGRVYRGTAIPELSGRYVFGDWSASSDSGDGTLFVAAPSPSSAAAWEFEEVAVADRPGGRIGEYVLSFGHDVSEEMYVLTTESRGPTGDTGKVYRLVPPK